MISNNNNKIFAQPDENEQQRILGLELNLFSSFEHDNVEQTKQHKELPDRTDYLHR